MKYNFTEVYILDLPSRLTVKADEQGTPLSLLTVVAMAMFRPSAADAQLALTEKIRKFRLGNKLAAADQGPQPKIIDLESDEVTLIKNCCNSLYGTLIVGQVVEFFESAATPSQLKSVS